MNMETSLADMYRRIAAQVSEGPISGLTLILNALSQIISRRDILRNMFRLAGNLSSLIFEDQYQRKNYTNRAASYKEKNQYG